MVIDSASLAFKEVTTIEGLPEGMYVEYLGRLPQSDKLFCIFRPREEWDYHDFSLVIGTHGSALRKIEITSVVRYRDGGTTDIESGIGRFHFPTCFKPEQKPTLNGEEIIVFPRIA